MVTDGGGWTVFQRRQDGSVDFYRYWTDYEDGFGNLNGEFWLGLSKIRRLTQEGPNNTLRVDLGGFFGDKGYAEYSIFSIGSSTTKYTLTVGGYSGNVTDGFSSDSGSKFTTSDSDNDKWQSGNCAQYYKGGWWYNTGCYTNVNINSRYNPSSGISWAGWYKFCEVKTRRSN